MTTTLDARAKILGGPTGELKKMRRTMREVFGLERLRPGQAEVMRSVISGHDTLAVMPTGAGKSLCYQLPALHMPGTTVIVSPLISLMKDQVDRLAEAGVEAAQVNGALTGAERRESLESIERGEGDREKLERMMLYGQSAECRWKLLHEYFGEPFERESCGHCDNCLHPLEERLGLTLNGADVPVGDVQFVGKKKAVELNEGGAVRVPKYGRGRVVSLEGDKVSVKFHDGETRVFKREFVRRA